MNAAPAIPRMTPIAIPPFAPPDNPDVLTSATGVLLELEDGATDVLPVFGMEVRLNGLERCVVLPPFDALPLLTIDALLILDALLLTTLTAMLTLVALLATDALEELL